MVRAPALEAIRSYECCSWNVVLRVRSSRIGILLPSSLPTRNENVHDACCVERRHDHNTDASPRAGEYAWVRDLVVSPGCFLNRSKTV